MSNSQNLRLLSKEYTFFKKNHTVFVFELIKMFTKREGKIKLRWIHVHVHSIQLQLCQLYDKEYI